MIKFVNSITELLSISKLRLLIIVLGFVFVSTLEALGIGLIGPFIYLASEPSRVRGNDFLYAIYSYLQFQEPIHFILLFGLAIICFFLFKSCVNWKVQSSIYRYSFTQEARLAKKLMQLYLSAPYVYHLKKDSSYVINTVLNDVKKLSLGVFVPGLTVVANVSVIASLSMLLFLTDPFVTIITLALILPIFIVIGSFRKKVRSWGEIISTSTQNSAKIVYESLGGIKEVKTIGCEAYFNRQLGSECDRYVQASAENFSVKIAPRMILEAVFISLIVSFTLLVLFTSGNASSIISTLGTFALVSIRLIPASSNLASSLINVRSKSYVVDKILMDLRELKQVIETSKDVSNLCLPNILNIGNGFRGAGLYKDTVNSSTDLNAANDLNFRDSISLKHLSYAYPGCEEDAISGVNVKIRKGQTVAFIGKSGAGKTTLVDLILGILLPGNGDIQVDGKSIYSNLKSWRKLIGYMPQSVYVIDDSIIKNVALGVQERDIDFERLSQCIRSAQLEDVVASLPDGIHTKLGERGVRLSGGQRQRVGIARALYHGSDILVLDEATSALDTETEELITESIRSLSHERTIIVIAHRLSTIKYCDKVFVMDRGRIIEEGSYKDVVLNNA